MLAVQAAGSEVTTIEGLAMKGASEGEMGRRAGGGGLDPIQQGFAECHGLQCGFCTPGMMLTARWLLDRNPDPSPEEIREALSGQICRCTGYENIVRSVLWAAKCQRGAPPSGLTSEDRGTRE
jgi:carbon-monoxide dehydrogenase small subunit